MKITRKSPLTGEENTWEIPVTQEQLDAWKNGMLIQKAMPNLTAGQREFLVTGYTENDWNKMFNEEN